VLRSLELAFIKTPLRRYEPLPNSPNDPCPSRTFSSTPGILTRLITKLVVFDTAHYLMQYTRPSLNDPAGDTLFDPSITLIPRYAKAPFLATCGAVVVYTSVGALYHFARLIAHFLLRQPDWARPPLSDRPWTSTSIMEYWSFHWHQFFRCTSAIYGMRPGGALLGKSGACKL
jgi:hypothetical protein